MISVGSYGVASAAFLSLFVLLCVGWISRHWAIAGLIVTFLSWALLGGWQAWYDQGSFAAYTFLDFARSIVLLCLVSDALHRLSGKAAVGEGARRFGILIPIIATIALVLGTLQLFDVEHALFLSLIGHVGIAVTGLFLIENLFQISRPNSLWTTKHLLIGTGTIFAFDLFLYTEALLFLRTDEFAKAAQPVIAVLAMPLILISARRLKDISISLPVSRGLLVSTTALMASGVYILGVAGIAYLIRGLGWSWGPTLQLIFLIGAAMVLLVLLSSTSLRHGGRRLIERNLFTFAYDYRREWRQLVSSMAGAADQLPLDKRALKATATLMDADGGVLFLRHSNGDLQYKSSWNIAIDDKTPDTPPMVLCQAFSSKRAAMAFGQAETMPPDLEQNESLRRWLDGFRDPWIALGLFAHSDLIGMIIITRPRMRRRLTWEDLDLLEIFGHQLGSYLTVEELARQVAEAEHFDRMSKHVTFVAHDLKNLISQLSLILQQAKHHAHNPAFVSDSFLTIGDAVEKMTLLMRRVQEGAREGALSPVDLNALVQASSIKQGCDQIDVSADGALIVDAEPSIFESVLDHIINNARDACQTEAHVTLTLRREGDEALLIVCDNGKGMTRDFIETELFKPFASTKSAGFGIGMYQCRDWIQRWRGRLTVESRLGIGTTVTIALPLSKAGSSERTAKDGDLDKRALAPVTSSIAPSIEEHAA